MEQDGNGLGHNTLHKKIIRYVDTNIHNYMVTRQEKRMPLFT